MGSESKIEYGHEVLRGFTNVGVRYNKGDFFIPRSYIQKDWLELLIKNQLISRHPVKIAG